MAIYLDKRSILGPNSINKSGERHRHHSAFAAKLTIFFDGNPVAINWLELGPFRGDERDSEYRLAYESGKAPSFFYNVGIRSSGRSAVVEIYDRAIKLENGSPHAA